MCEFGLRDSGNMIYTEKGWIKLKVNRNIPNILCIFRIIMIPFILIFMLDNPVSEMLAVWVRMLIAGILFGIAMLTDLFDGKIARRYDLVSNLGKFLDPIADKMLVVSVLCAFVGNDVMPVLPLIIIIGREFCVTMLRMIAAGTGDVLSAKIWGKVKTTLQAIVIGAVFVYLMVMYILNPDITGFGSGCLFSLVPGILVWILAIVTVISAVPYFKGSKKYLR